jgi:cardiolipin synthase A/B
MPGAEIFLYAFTGAFATAIYFMLSRRRRTPPLEIDLDAMPPIGEALATLSGVTGSSVYCHNRGTIHQNGAIFEAMAADIGAARGTVHLESFVWTKGTLERRFTDLLCERARAGVAVRVLLDFVGGSRASLEQVKRMDAAGVDLRFYARPRWWNLGRVNHRTHRKLLIVDGRIGYTFGHGIADQWLGDGEDREHWRDTGVRLEGTVVHALQGVFMENWIEESKCVPAGEACFPKLEDCGSVDAHVVSSACGEDVSSVALLYTAAMACARREVIIQNPYFAPDDSVLDLFRKLVARGVAIHLMVPGEHTDSPFVRRAGRCLYEGLLRAGVRVYEFEPTLLHQKIVIVDGAWAHIGSTNFDSRSLAINEEVGIGLLDEAIAGELKAAFEADLERSRELTLAQWTRRGRLTRLLDWIAYRLHGQL